MGLELVGEKERGGKAEIYNFLIFMAPEIGNHDLGPGFWDAQSEKKLSQITYVLATKLEFLKFLHRHP